MNALTSIFAPISSTCHDLFQAVDYLENKPYCLSQPIPLEAFIRVQYDYWQDESWFPNSSDIDEMALESVLL